MVLRFNVSWSIPNAGPSVSVFHTAGTGSANVNGINAALRAFFVANQARLPDNISVSFPTEAVVINDATGETTGFVPLTTLAVVTGTSTAGWGAGLGARVVWGTGAVRNGRRVRGSTFLVPLANTSFDTNGRVADTTRTAVTASASALEAAVSQTGVFLGVYSRPHEGASDGLINRVTNVDTSPVPGTLRGRKY